MCKCHLFFSFYVRWYLGGTHSPKSHITFQKYIIWEYKISLQICTELCNCLSAAHVHAKQLLIPGCSHRFLCLNHHNRLLCLTHQNPFSSLSCSSPASVFAYSSDAEHKKLSLSVLGSLYRTFLNPDPASPLVSTHLQAPTVLCARD